MLYFYASVTVAVKAYVFGLSVSECVQWRSQDFVKGSIQGSAGRKSPNGVQGQSPDWGLGAKPPEARDNSQKIALKVA